MATFTIYAAASDGYALTNNPSYATALSGPPIIWNSVDTIFFVGQRWTGTNYQVMQGFVEWDTSPLAGATAINSVTASLSGNTDLSDTDFTAEILSYDWGGSVGSSDWRTPANLGSYPRLAYWNSAGYSAGYNAFTSEAAFASAINTGGFTRVVVASDRNRTSTTPTGNERVHFHSADQAGTTDDPKLVIDAEVSIPVDVTGDADGLAITEGAGDVVIGSGADLIGAAEGVPMAETGGTFTAGRRIDVTGNADTLAVVEAGGDVVAGAGADIQGAAEAVGILEVAGPFQSVWPGDIIGAAEELVLIETGGALIAGLGVDLAGVAEGLTVMETGGAVVAGAAVYAVGPAEALILTETGGDILVGAGVVASGAAEALGLIEVAGDLVAGTGTVLQGMADTLALVEVIGTFVAGLGFDSAGAADLIALVETGGSVSIARMVDVAGPADMLAVAASAGDLVAGRAQILTGAADRLALDEAGGPFTAFNPNRPAPRWRTATASYESRTYGAR
jgi:hypothetical protein